MPTYEYRCPKGHDFEHFVLRMSEAQSLMACPTCGAEAERRMSAGGGLLFKGSGFYITDYGKDGKKDQRARPAALSDAGPGSKEGSSGPKSGADSAASGKSGGDTSGSEKSGGDSKAAAPAKPKADPAPKPSSSSGSSDK